MSAGLIVAAASSHSGKTVLSAGLIAAFRRRGLSVATAKCGPDYLDPRFLEAASGRPAFNLDPWAMRPEAIEARLAELGSDADLVVIEGVMGLYDGGIGGVGSTASLATMTGLPAVLVVAAEGLAQSAAAIAEGFARLAEGFEVAGAIVNQVASDRHADFVREGFARASVPLLGLIRRDPSIRLASRHLGLIQAEEHADLAATITRAAGLVEKGCDLDAILTLATTLPPPLRRRAGEGGKPPPQRLTPLGQRIAIARDIAFGFAYPHLLADWRKAGAEISFFSPLADEAPDPAADAVFLPGGYPELHAGTIAAAGHFRAGMKRAAQRSALIYGECGGYMVMGEGLIDGDGVQHRMLGLLPLVTSFETRRLHLGYRRLTPLGGSPWPHAVSAHEFHYATIVSEGAVPRLFSAEDAARHDMGQIGMLHGSMVGSFAHVIDAL